MTASAWDPATKSAHFTLSNSNYTATGDATASAFSLISINGKSSGKWYAEIKPTTLASIATALGIALSSFSNSTDPHSDASVACVRAGGSVTAGASTGGTSSNFSTTYTTNDVVQIALDATGGNLWFGVNNTYPSSGNPSTGANAGVTGLTGTFFLCAGALTVGSMVAVIQQTLTYALPTGYTQWGVPFTPTGGVFAPTRLTYLRR